MNIFDKIKEQVTARQAAENYGIKVARNGMACCPFHNDRHPSMKIDKNYHCFACNIGGDVVDFTARMFGLSQLDAAKKLILDFNLPIKLFEKKNQRMHSIRVHPTHDNRKSEKKKVIDIRIKFDKWLDEAIEILIRYLKWIEFWKEFYKPGQDEEWHELFVEALDNERKINDYLDILMYGNGDEMIQFFQAKREEVKRIEKRITEYQRSVIEDIRKEISGNGNSGRSKGSNEHDREREYTAVDSELCACITV